MIHFPRVRVLLFLLAGLACVAGWQALSLPSTSRITVGLGDDARYVADWHDAEKGNAGFRWSTGNSRLILPSTAGASSTVIQLRMTGPQFPDAPVVPLTATTSTGYMFQTTIAPEWRVYHVLIPQGNHWNAAQLRLQTPVFEPGADRGDTRDLGIALSSINTSSTGRNVWSTVEYALWLLAAATLFTLLSSVVLRSPSWLVGGGLIALIAGFRWLMPTALPYYFPPMWNLLLLVGFGLGLYLSRPWWGLVRLHPVLALVLTMIGAWLARGDVLPVIGIPLMVLGAIAIVGKETGDAAVPQSWSNLDYGLLVGIFMLALGLRAINLNETPLGLWRDEARHGLLALRILKEPGYYPVYNPEVDLPSLLFYLQAAAISLLGPTPAAVRIVPALAGSLTVIPLYLLGRRWGGRGLAVGAALLLATSSWHIALSRIAFPTVLDPLFLVSAIVALDSLFRDRLSPRELLLRGASAGIAVGLALYTYHTGRLAPVAVGGLVLVQIWGNRRRLKTLGWGLAAGALAFTLVALPLVRYAVTNSEAFNKRIGMVSELTNDSFPPSRPGQVADNAAAYAGMWLIQGDSNARHHVAKKPFFDPFTAAALLIGSLVVLSPRRPRWAGSAIWLLGVGLIPGIFSGDAPHAMRGVDCIVPSILIAAEGLRHVASLRLGGLGQYSARWAVAAGMVGAMAFNAWVYFVVGPNDPATWSKIGYVAETRMGLALQHNKLPVAMPKRVLITDVMRYLSEKSPVIELDATTSCCIPITLLPNDASDSEKEWAVHATGGQLLPGARFPGSERVIFYQLASREIQQR